MSALARLLPAQADNRFGGLRAALWLLGALIFLRTAMSLNSILNTDAVAAGADGIPLASFGEAGARQVLQLFALMALGHLTITLIALTILVRYRALVPFIYLVLLGEWLVRRFVAQGYAAPGAETTLTAWIVNGLLFGLMALGLLMSLVPGGRPALVKVEEGQ